MPVNDLKTDLMSATPALFASKWIFERTPHIFGSDRDSYILWKHRLGELIDVDPLSIGLVGSAAVGASLNPYKNLKPFDDDSDVDVSVVSGHYFNIVWRWLRGLGPERYGYAPSAQDWIKEHRQRLLYWGVIATDRLLPLTPLATIWVTALASISKLPPINGREVNIRLYADFDALRAYHVNSIRQLRQNLSAVTA